MTPTVPTGPRRLLGRLRDVMAGSGTAQQRLDMIVRILASDMVAEVCSIYIMRAGEVLELFATQGLKPTAVHKTRLRVGEGLVGHIAAHARPLALADAQSHPNFAYRPETGEEIYHSLMGVPVLRGGRVVGVLVVQNRSRRHYTEEEVETLQTVAMVLAELVAGGELVDPAELAPVEGNALLPVRLDGLSLNAGLAIGTAVLHQPRITIERMVAEDPERELERLRKALADMHGALDALLNSDEMSAGEHRDILETYRMFAQDSGWIARIGEAIRSGLTAEAAVQKVDADTRARLSQVTDPYLRERLHDLEDLANRLLQHLTGEVGTAAAEDLPEEFVLVARNMGPAELLDYDRRKLRGVVLEEGSPTSHVAIVARALDIPVVGRVREVLDKIEPGHLAIVDGDNAQIFLRPGDDIVQAYSEGIAFRVQRRAMYRALKDVPAVTLDGVPISLQINAGLLIDLQHLAETGAEGVGLYRTEIPFMARTAFPDVEAQTALYAKILDASEGRPVVFRTLDAGGDKLLPYWAETEEENPAMGWRSIRITLDQPAILRQQIRALMRAGTGRDLSIMFPMIAEVAEFDAAKAVLDLEVERMKRRGEPLPSSLKVGAMLEVPALMFQLPGLLERIDFLSVGSNDLMQFLFATDRGNPRLVERYDALSPAALTMLRQIIDACDRAGKPLSLCGEMGGRPLEAMALIGLGFRCLSVSPPAIGAVKIMVRSLTLEPLQRYLETLLNSSCHSVREKLRSFALDHGVMI